QPSQSYDRQSTNVRGRIQIRGQRPDQLRAAALARSLALHSSRKTFISALSLVMRAATPVYFFVVPVTVCYGRASRIRLNGVSVARRNRVNPPCVTTSRKRA